MCLEPTQTQTNSKNINFLNESRQMGANPEIQLEGYPVLPARSQRVKQLTIRETYAFSET